MLFSQGSDTIKVLITEKRVEKTEERGGGGNFWS
jgi:hypothetical protein